MLERRQNPFLTAQLSFIQQRSQPKPHHYLMYGSPNTERQNLRNCNPFEKEELFSPSCMRRSHSRSQASFSLSKSNASKKITVQQMEKERAREEQMEKHRKIISAYGIESMRYTRVTTQAESPPAPRFSQKMKVEDLPSPINQYQISSNHELSQKILLQKKTSASRKKRQSDTSSFARYRNIENPPHNRSNKQIRADQLPTFKTMNRQPSLNNIKALEESSMSDMIGSQFQEQPELADHILERSRNQTLSKKSRRSSNMLQLQRSKQLQMAYQSQMSNFYDDMDRRYRLQQQESMARKSRYLSQFLNGGNYLDEDDVWPNEIEYDGTIFQRIDVI